MGRKISLVEINQTEGGFAFSRIERKIQVLKSTLQSNQSSLFGLRRNRCRGEGEPDGQVVSTKVQAKE